MLAYGALTIALYGRVVGWDWCCDDTQILLHALEYSPWQYFAVPEAWRALVPFSLTPWLSLSYDLDHTLFGAWPAAFYARQLMSLALSAWMIHLLARPWTGPLPAAAGAILFLVGVPVAHASHTLMVRHYIEGLFAFLLALWLLQRRLQGGRAWLVAAAALSFAVAASAKEVYLPLGLLVLVLPVGRWPERLRAGWPVLLVMLLYVPWRTYMLGTVIGGYTPIQDLQGSLLQGVRQLAGLWALTSSQPLLSLLVTGLLAGAAWWRAGLRLQAPVLHLLGLALLMAPLVPLALQSAVGPGMERLLIAPWAALSLATAFWLHRSSVGAPHWAAAACAVLAAALALAAWPLSRHELRKAAPAHREYGAHFRLLTSGEGRDALLVSTWLAPHFVHGALDLRRHLGRHGPAPALLADESELAGPESGARTLWRYDTGLGRLVDASDDLPARLAAWRDKLRVLPLQVRMNWDAPSRVVRWQLGPPQEASFALLAPSKQVALPSTGAIFIDKPLPCFRIRRDANDGTVSYSPWLRLRMDRAESAQLEWQGSSLDYQALEKSPACPQ